MHRTPSGSSTSPRLASTRASRLGALLSQGPVTPALVHMFTDEQGFTWLSEDDFVNHFAADVEPARARVLHAAQQKRWRRRAFNDVDRRPGLEGTAQLVPRRFERRGHPAGCRTTVRGSHERVTIEIPSSHVAMVSHPSDVASLIKTAADKVGG